MNSSNAFDRILQFERELAKFTGAPYAIMTDCCTHAIELCLRYEIHPYRHIASIPFTAYTYLSVPMTFHKVGIDYQLIDEPWIGEYQFHKTTIWDSARRLEANMYRPGMMQCLSFGHNKPLHIGRGGAILLDNEQAYHDIILMRYDGRDLNNIPWTKQQEFKVGYHYKPTPEEAEIGLALLEGIKVNKPVPEYVEYADLRQFTIRN